KQRQMDKRERMHSQMHPDRQNRSRRGYEDRSSLRSSSNAMQNINWQKFGGQGIQASTLMDKKVRNTNDENLGTVDDVVITPAGDIRLILSVGEALNIKDKRIQADLQDIEFKEDADYIVYDVSKQELKNDPEYTPDKRTATPSKKEKNEKSAGGAQTSANKEENTKKQQQ
ncbi:MAG TPA: PRC-barrel domain-containing protein, partial [Desulfopila sp.]|nr:PRC-barrel domain-containing protein [Desulfopila sp.]